MKIARASVGYVLLLGLAAVQSQAQPSGNADEWIAQDYRTSDGLTAPMTPEEEAQLKGELQSLEKKQEQEVQARMDNLALGMLQAIEIVAQLVNDVTVQDLRGPAYGRRRYPPYDSNYYDPGLGPGPYGPSYDQYYPVPRAYPRHRRPRSDYYSSGRYSSPNQMDTPAGVTTEIIGDAVRRSQYPRAPHSVLRHGSGRHEPGYRRVDPRLK